MQYHVHHLGKDLGRFTAEELQDRRASGQLTGVELVWCEGMPSWLPLDAVFPPPAPPALPAPAVVGRPPRAVWLGLAMVAVAVVVGLGIVGIAATVRVLKRAKQPATSATQSKADPRLTAARERAMEAYREGVELAARPVPVATNSFTFKERRIRARAFREHQYLQGYRLHADHTSPCDKASEELIRSWLNHEYGTPDGQQRGVNPEKLAVDLVADAACNDGIALTVAGIVCDEQRERIRRLERALAAFEGSRHKAYPRFYAAMLLANTIDNQPERDAELDRMAVKLFGEMLADGSVRPEDQAELAETLVFGWGAGFFSRNREELYGLRDRGGSRLEWLSAVIEGQHHILEAWKSRGGGYANTVTTQGQRGFDKHLASAETALTRAWNLRTNLALPAVRMIYVTMGTGDTEEMRTWFDRAISAELDHPEAWSAMRFALYPRWHGSVPAMIALGETALNTGRFDTDVPRMLFDSLTAAEGELGLTGGRRIFGRTNVWPLLDRMYRGYIDAQPDKDRRRGWRSTFAAVAYLAGRNDVVREQLEAVDWNPQPGSLQGWNMDLSLMPLEVAALAGSAADAVGAADKAHAAGRLSQAGDAYAALAGRSDLDARTREYARIKGSLVESERKLGRGEWVPFLPVSDNDPQWTVNAGKISTPKPGEMEVSSGSDGHMLVSRMRVGTDFAIRGEWEKVSSTTVGYQAGFVFGHPSMNNRAWYSFRMKNNMDDGPVASVGHGWARPQYIVNAPVHPDKNTFEFRFKGGKASLTLNEVVLYEDQAIPEWMTLNRDQFRLGIGAFNDTNETVVRYRKVEIKRL